MSFSVLAKGPSSKVRQFGVSVIRDSESWRSHWNAHYTGVAAGDGPPPVDFTVNSVACLHLGQRNTGGYSVVAFPSGKPVHISLHDLVTADGELQLVYKVSTPARGSMTMQMITTPFEFALIPKVDERLAVKAVEKSSF
ncbi:hypothetical protein BJ742DRAFT_745274 [Cladochytrium replicatum]|nr:hypothetical protein BJ742DRAFT_745274 [Cladochytrium replicatum]